MHQEAGVGGRFGFTRWGLQATIAAVEGHCVAGGLRMTHRRDRRVAGRGATFGCFERRFGVPLVGGVDGRFPCGSGSEALTNGIQRLPLVVGPGARSS